VVSKEIKTARASAEAEELIWRILHVDFGYDYLRDAVKIDITEQDLCHPDEIIMGNREKQLAIAAAGALDVHHDAVFIIYGHSVMLLHFRKQFIDVYSFAYSSTSWMYSFYPTCTTFGTLDLELIESFEHGKLDNASHLIATGREEDAGAERVVETRVIQYLSAAFFWANNPAKASE
jgi:hypothetical protein